jgi:hypothetical protein
MGRLVMGLPISHQTKTGESCMGWKLVLETENALDGAEWAQRKCPQGLERRWTTMEQRKKENLVLVPFASREEAEKEKNYLEEEDHDSFPVASLLKSEDSNRYDFAMPSNKQRWKIVIEET